MNKQSIKVTTKKDSCGDKIYVVRFTNGRSGEGYYRKRLLEWASQMERDNKWEAVR